MTFKCEIVADGRRIVEPGLWRNMRGGQVSRWLIHL